MTDSMIKNYNDMSRVKLNKYRPKGIYSCLINITSHKSAKEYVKTKLKACNSSSHAYKPLKTVNKKPLIDDIRTKN